VRARERIDVAGEHQDRYVKVFLTHIFNEAKSVCNRHSLIHNKKIVGSAGAEDAGGFVPVSGASDIAPTLPPE
jgi:ABC-type Na+ transport system ATPase subunit NatA